MTAFFSDVFRQAVFDTGAGLFPLTFKVYFFPVSPNYAANDARYTGIETVDDLARTLGWGPYVPITSEPMPVGQTILGRNHYVIMSNPIDIPDNFPTYSVRSVAFAAVGGPLDGKLLMVTNTPFLGVPVVFYNTDSIIARQDASVARQRWLFSWADPAGGTTVALHEGPLALLKGAPDFEPSHTQHAWLYPQRVNLVANPSFEGGVGWWRTNGTCQKVSGGSPGGGYNAGKFTGPSPLIAESNYFPTVIGKKAVSEFTVQVMARGNGKMRIGLISWPDDWSHVYVDWGDPAETQELSGVFHHIYALRAITDAEVAQLRIECLGTEMIIDNVLVEPDWLLYWPYFDGDSTYGNPDDFSWYGGENQKGSSYSLWYNNRRAVVGRLFAWEIGETDPTITDEEEAKQGFVYKWVPAGTRVIPHLDVLHINDIRSPVIDIEDSDVTPDVEDPWAEVDITAPTAPINLVADPGISDVDLTWTGSTDEVGVTGYRIERCTGTSCVNFTLIGTALSTSYHDFGLLSLVTYRYRVAALDAAGNVSAYSNIVTVRTETGEDLEPPTAPTNLLAVTDGTDPTQINLTWDPSFDNVGVDHYVIERCLNVT